MTIQLCGGDGGIFRNQKRQVINPSTACFWLFKTNHKYKKTYNIIYTLIVKMLKDLKCL
jgi:hypothetical protein